MTSHGVKMSNAYVMTRPHYPGSRNKRGGATTLEENNYKIRVHKELTAARKANGLEDDNFFPLTMSEDRRFSNMPWLNPNDVPPIPRTIVPAHSDTGRNVLGVNPAHRGAASPDVMNWQKPGADRDPNKPADMIEPRHGFTRTVLGGYFQDTSFNIHVPVFNKSASTSSLREARAKNPYEMQQQLEGSQSARKMTRYESRGAIRPVASPQPASSRPTTASARPRPATAGFPHEAGIPRVLTPNGGTRSKTIEYIPPPTGSRAVRAS